jgi:hypothetical protein
MILYGQAMELRCVVLLLVRRFLFECGFFLLIVQRFLIVLSCWCLRFFVVVVDNVK